MLFDGLKRLADNYMQIWNADSEGLLDIYAAENLVVEYTHSSRIEGIPAYKTFLKNTYQSFPDLKIEIGEIFPNKRQEQITLLWSYSGTHQNNVLFGIPPEGKKISVNGMTFLQIKNKKIVLEKGIIDNLSLLMQLHPLK